MLISKKKRIILWGLVIVAVLAWFWNTGQLICEAARSNPLCKGVRSISGSIVPHIDLGNFYKTYIKKPLCKVRKAIGLIDTPEKVMKRLVKKVCPKKGVYVSPNIIHIIYTTEFAEEVLRYPEKYEEVIKHIKQEYPEIIRIKPGIPWAQDGIEDYVKKGRPISPYYFSNQVYIEEPKYKFKDIAEEMMRRWGDHLSLAGCPQNQDDKTIKKSKKIINQLKTDIFLKGKVSDVFTWVCGENFDALTHFFGPQPRASLREFPEDDYQCLRINENFDKKEHAVIRKFLARSVQPDCAIPNDTLFYRQWYLRNMPQKFDCAWPISTGSSDIIVNVIDTGVTKTHEDLKVGFLDFPQSISYVFGECGRDKEVCKSPFDFCRANCTWHGHKVHGLINATINNRIGITGASPKVSVGHIRDTSEHGQGSFFRDLCAVAEGIRFASSSEVPLSCVRFIDCGKFCLGDNKYPNPGTPKKKANVINISVASHTCDPIEYIELQYEIGDAIANGIPIVVAAGNYGCSDVTSWDTVNDYVAQLLADKTGTDKKLWLKRNGLIIMGSMTRGLTLASYSNFSQYLDFLAFGGEKRSGGEDKLNREILSTINPLKVHLIMT